MRKLLLAITLTLAICVTAHSQDEPKVCISAESANKCASAVAELLEARTVISEFTVERTTSIAERQAAAKVIEGLNSLLTIKDRQIASYEQINALYRQTIELQSQIITRLEDRLNKPKSAFQKLVGLLRDLSFVLAGISLGRIL